MAVPFSSPVSSRERRVRRESAARSTGINTLVSFPDLSLQSQLLYLALLEAWRVLRMITHEQGEVVFQEGREENGFLMEDTEETGFLVDNREETDVLMDDREEAGFLLDDTLTAMEDIKDFPATDQVDTRIGGVHMKTTTDDINKRAGDTWPDLIQNKYRALDKPAVAAQLPDLVLSCQPSWSERRSSAGSWDCSRSNARRSQESNSQRICRGQRSSGKNYQDLNPRLPSTPPQGPRVPKNLTPELPSNSSTSAPVPFQPCQSDWAEMGRQLDKIAGQTRKKDGQTSPSFSSPSSFSDILSTVALCGLSYLGKKMFM